MSTMTTNNQRQAVFLCPTATMRSLLLLLASLALSCRAFVPAPPRSAQASCSSTTVLQAGGGFFEALGNFWEELDAFVDDASARRLGNGAAFYGKRRSNFYGQDDKMKKMDRKVADPTEDYQGPTSSGFFKWMPDEDGQMRPVTRMKEKVIEQKSSKFWEG